VSESGFSLPQLDARTLPGPETILRRELSNGMVVLARENFSSPSVVLTGDLKVGSLGETREQAGRAHLTSLALMRGTHERTFRQIFESIESIGARLYLSSGTHATVFHGKSLVEDLGLLLDLLADVLRNPAFPKPEVERLKAERLTALAIRDQDTGARAQLAFDELAYADHPYCLPTDGFQETVGELTSSDLRTFHKSHYGPRSMVIAVVGAVEAEAAVAAVEKSLGGWHKPQQTFQPELPPVRQLQNEMRRVVPIAGKSQCDVVLGTPGPSRFDEGFLAAALGNNILGRFGLFGRIGDAVRDAAGLAYYAYSSLSGGLGPGPWQVNAGVNPANVERAIELIRAEIKRFTTKHVSRDELVENQANFIGGLPLQFESNEGVANSLVHIERYNLGLNYYQLYPELIASITRAQVLEAARRFLDSDRLAMAIAGPVEKPE
jgi:zinc protease